MSAQHTPGPWEWGKDRRWLFRDNLKADGKFSSSTIMKIDDDAFRPSEADAHMSAAAPELYEALLEARIHVAADIEEASDPDGRGQTFLPVYEARLAVIDAALAKARGEP